MVRKPATGLQPARQPLSVLVLAMTMAALWWLLPQSRASGEPPPGPVTTPTGEFTAVGVGEYHACAVRTNGDAACWGGNDQGQAPLRIAGPFKKSISAGVTHSCAIREDRSIACWGDNFGGMAPPWIAGQFSTVSVGSHHTCALRVDGDISCWGLDFCGEAPAHMAGPFIWVSTGPSHTCAVRGNGDIVCFGQDSVGQVPPKTSTGRSRALLPDGLAAAR